MAKQLNFKALKERITMTSELIQKYQENDHKLKESLSEVAALRHCIEGLKTEVQTLHQENEALKTDYNKCLTDNDELRDSLELEKLLTQQLTAQVEEFQEDRIKYDTKNVKKMTADIKKLKSENSKLKTRYVKLLKSTDPGNEPTNSKPPPSTLSPPYTPLEPPPPKPLTPTPTPSPPDHPLISPAVEITSSRPSTSVFQEGVSLTPQPSIQLELPPTGVRTLSSASDNSGSLPHPLLELGAPPTGVRIELAAADTACEDEDNDMVEWEPVSPMPGDFSTTRPLSPIPASPMPTRPLSPMPPSPTPDDFSTTRPLSPIPASPMPSRTLSPIPASPIPSDISTTRPLSPIPASPMPTRTISPMPASPIPSDISTTRPLSPIPASPMPSRTISPMPASPIPSDISTTRPLSPIPASPMPSRTISPMPASPIPSDISTTRPLSPIPASPMPTRTISPMPASPIPSDISLSPMPPSPTPDDFSTATPLSPIPASPIPTRPLSPMPTSPTTDDFSTTRPLSPIPASPMPTRPLSPMPSSPTTDDFSTATPLSPMPASPMPTRPLSPMSYSPVPEVRALSPMPLSPSPSFVVSPLPHSPLPRPVSPINAHQDALSVVSPLPQSPVAPASHLPPPHSPVSSHRDSFPMLSPLAPLAPASSLSPQQDDTVKKLRGMLVMFGDVENVLSPLPASPVCSRSEPSGGGAFGKMPCVPSPLPVSPVRRRGDLSPLRPSDLAGSSGSCCSGSGEVLSFPSESRLKCAPSSSSGGVLSFPSETRLKCAPSSPASESGGVLSFPSESRLKCAPLSPASESGGVLSFPSESRLKCAPLSPASESGEVLSFPSESRLKRAPSLPASKSGGVLSFPSESRLKHAPSLPSSESDVSPLECAPLSSAGGVNKPDVCTLTLSSSQCAPGAESGGGLDLTRQLETAGQSGCCEGEVAELLLEGGAHVDKVGQSALLSSTSQNCEQNERCEDEIAELLLEGGAHVDKVGQSALLSSTSQNCEENGHHEGEIAELLLEGGAHVDKDEQSALLGSASRNREQSGRCEVVLESGGLPTYLGAADQGEECEVAQLLLESCQVDIPEKKGQSALIGVSENRHSEVAKLLPMNAEALGESDDLSPLPSSPTIRGISSTPSAACVGSCSNVTVADDYLSDGEVVSDGESDGRDSVSVMEVEGSNAAPTPHSEVRCETSVISPPPPLLSPPSPGGLEIVSAPSTSRGEELGEWECPAAKRRCLQSRSVSTRLVVSSLPSSLDGCSPSPVPPSAFTSSSLPFSPVLPSASISDSLPFSPSFSSVSIAPGPSASTCSLPGPLYPSTSTCSPPGPLYPSTSTCSPPGPLYPSTSTCSPPGPLYPSTSTFSLPGPLHPSSTSTSTCALPGPLHPKPPPPSSRGSAKPISSTTTCALPGPLPSSMKPLPCYFDLESPSPAPSPPSSKRPSKRRRNCKSSIKPTQASTAKSTSAPLSPPSFKSSKLTPETNSSSSSSKSFPLDLLPEATPFSPPSTPSKSAPSPAPSHLPIAQQQLSKPMLCPLTLPCWLVMCMTQVQGLKQHCMALGHHMGKKKGIAPAKPLFISAKQNPVNYIHSNLVRMCCGHLHLSTTITMFTSPQSAKLTCESMVAAVLKFFQMSYSPDIEHVVDLFRKQQATLNSKNHFTIEPPDPNFPPALLRPEAQLVALLAHVCRMHASMGKLLTETCKALYQAMLNPRVKFHRLIAMARVFTALLRLQVDPNPLLFFLDDLLKKPLPPSELNVVGSIVGVWPAPLGRKKDVRLLKGQRLCQEGLEDQMLSYTLEVAVMSKYGREGKAAGIQESFAWRLHLLCNWSISHTPQTRTTLTSALVELLKSSPNASITYCPPGHTPWQFPRPSQVACQVVRCLSLLASCQGWSWTNDVLIAKQLWPVLQQWHGQRKGGGVVEMREVVVVCVLRLIGYVSQLGLKQEPPSPSVQQLQGTLVALLRESLTNQIPLAIQLAALDSLLETCPPGSGGEAVARVREVIGAWLQAQGDQPWKQALGGKINSKLKM